MTLGERLRGATRALEAVSDTPRLDAEILLAHAMGISRAKLLAELREPFAHPEFETLLARRLNYEPIAYILGDWEFYSLRILCRAPILVPRPETEHLVEVALDHLKHHPAPTKQVLDLCTGTGCVAVVLAKHQADADVWAVDINPVAVALATENAARHACRVHVLQGDLFGALPPEAPKFDVITANPPYVPEEEWPSLPEVIRRHEDPLALLSGPEGLDCLTRIAVESRAWLHSGALLAMEMGEDQGPRAASLLESLGYTQVNVMPDLAGHDRIVHGVWPG